MTIIDVRPLTVSRAAEALGLPGPTPQARAQLLRRLEARGVVPPARRSLAHGDRYYLPQETERLRELIRKRTEEGRGAE